jgi:DNA-binding PucR family transcriptional regulator
VEDEAHGVRVVVHAVAAALNARLGEITASMGSVLAEGIGELGDQRLRDLLGSSIEGNVENIFHLLRHDIPLSRVTPPSAAFKYARRLAQHDVPVHALVRAYRLGQNHLLEQAYVELERQPESSAIRLQASARIVSATFAYIDWISERVISEYESEREQWLVHRNTRRAIAIRELIEGVDLDVAAAESATGYPLNPHHLGLILWTPDRHEEAAGPVELERLAAAIAKKLCQGSQVLFSTSDRRTGWAWIALGAQAARLDSAEVGRIARSADPRVQVALGGAAQGRAGFRATHVQARQAQRLAVVAGAEARVATDYLDSGVRAAALLCADLEHTRMLVQTALGDLARDDEQAARLRDTLRVYLSTGSSYTATAELLSMHKHSVKYRIEKAQQLRGGPFEPERFDIELALIACQLLGRDILG